MTFFYIIIQVLSSTECQIYNILFFEAFRLRTFELNSTFLSYKLIPGGNVALNFYFEFDQDNSSLPNPEVTFKGRITIVEFNTSLAVIDNTRRTISFELLPVNFNDLGFENHSCEFSLSTNSTDTLNVNVTVSYEEPITNLQVRFNDLLINFLINRLIGFIKLFWEI